MLNRLNDPVGCMLLHMGKFSFPRTRLFMGNPFWFSTRPNIKGFTGQNTSHFNAFPAIKMCFMTPLLPEMSVYDCQDRKSTRLNSSHVSISYAVFFLTKTTM